MRARNRESGAGAIGGKVAVPAQKSAKILGRGADCIENIQPLSVILSTLDYLSLQVEQFLSTCRKDPISQSETLVSINGIS